MSNAKNEISASDFKKYFLSLVDEVKNKHTSFVITKRKVPIAKVVPLDDKSEKMKSYFGFLKGSIKINDDIVNTTFEDEWEINQ
jgi:prevent-host-death family protein